MNRLGIEFLTVLGLPLVEFIELAAQLGCPNISTTLSGHFVNPNGFPDFDLRQDKTMRSEVIAALRDNEVAISLGEGMLIQPGKDVGALQGDLELMRQLGVQRINAVSMEPDVGRTFDQYARLAELAAEAGMSETTAEFAPVLTLRDLPTALEAVRHVGRPDFKLLIDTMHFGRTGGSAADLASLDPALIGYVQLCDVPLVPTISDYMQESMGERLSPGEGELPLRDMLAAVPRDIIVSLEIPKVGKALAGEPRRETVGAMVAAARAMLQGLDRPVGSAQSLR